MKIDDFVRFPTQLTITYTIDANEYNAQYRIMGIVVHEGPSIAQGHYIAYVRAEDKWYCANDATITAVRWQTVCREKAYLLFYEKL